MARVLVTGGAGFIGSHVVDDCLARGLDVVATDDLSGGCKENVSESARWVPGDIRDPDFVAGLWQQGPFDVVYHLAAYAAEGLSHFIRSFNYRTNLLASVALINQAVLHDVRRFVFTSSIAVYGHAPPPMTEEQTPQPSDPYGISKYAVELDLAAAHEIFGLEYTIFRPHNVYGERQNIADPYRNVVGIFANAAMQGRPMPVFGDGLQTRAFSHVADVAPAIARCPYVDGATNEVFNVGADVPCTIVELATVVADAFGVDAELEYLPEREEVTHAYCDHTKCREVFRSGPPVALRDGVARMAAWATAHGPRPPVGFRGAIEVPRNMPPSWSRALPLLDAQWTPSALKRKGTPDLRA